MTLGSSQVIDQIIRQRRVRAGLSQKALADLAELHITYISLLERGHRNPNLDTLAKLGRALNCPVWKLVWEVERKLGQACRFV